MFAITIIDSCDSFEFGNLNKILVRILVSCIFSYHRGTSKNPEKFNHHTNKKHWTVTKYQALPKYTRLSYSMLITTFYINFDKSFYRWRNWRWRKLNKHTKFNLRLPMGLSGKESTCKQETWVRILGWEDPLEEEMANHSSILALEGPWREDGLQSMGLQSQTQLSN